MKKDYLLGILFFSGLWGISEAVLGDILYRADVPYASVPLSIIGFCLLTFARIYLPQKGTATFIAACAMLYKFLNAPFFACHLLGIFLMGLAYDLFFSIFNIKNRAFSAAAATYLSYGLFAFLMTYVFKYDFWTQAGFTKLAQHVGLAGSFAALGCAVLVPLSFRLGEHLKANFAQPFQLRLQLVPGSASAIAIGLWAFSLVAYFVK